MRDGTATIDEETQLELDVKCLQILRALIYNKFVFIDEEDKERCPEKYRKYGVKICSFECKVMFCTVGYVAIIFILFRKKSRAWIKWEQFRE